MHEVLVNRLGGLSLPRKSVVRLTDRPDMTLDVYRGRKTTMQQLQQFIGIGMLDGGLVLGPVTGTYHSLFQKEKSLIYRHLPLVYLTRLVESLDTMFRLQDIKV